VLLMTRLVLVLVPLVASSDHSHNAVGAAGSSHGYGGTTLHGKDAMRGVRQLTRSIAAHLRKIEDAGLEDAQAQLQALLEMPAYGEHCHRSKRCTSDRWCHQESDQTLRRCRVNHS
jgi:hypothetical protein